MDCGGKPQVGLNPNAQKKMYVSSGIFGRNGEHRASPSSWKSGCREHGRRTQPGDTTLQSTGNQSMGKFLMRRNKLQIGLPR